MSNQQPIPSDLIAHLNRGDCVLFVGDALDGVSQSARLAAALVDACGAQCPFCRDAGKCLRPDDCVTPLFRAAQLYEGRTNRQALVDFVLRHIDTVRLPDPLHRALVELPVRVIITTAYDDRLEAALRAAGRPFLSVVRDTDVPFDDPDRVQLIRLYGTASQPDTLVLTEDDAADLFGRSPVITKILQGHFASKRLLFLGYQLADMHFLALYNQVTGPIVRYHRLAYAVQPKPDPLLVDRWRGRITLQDAEPLPLLMQLAQSVRVEVRKVVPATLPPEPYKFLDYYTRDDAAIFFGRDLEADLLLSTILAHGLTVFYGRSGTGKTSLLLAEVAPQLEAAGYWVAYVRMLGDPASEIKAAVRKVSLESLSYADRECTLREVLRDAVPPGGRLVVVLDQFEEFFLRQSNVVRAAFAQELAACLRPEADQTAPDLRFVFSLRDDYLGALDELSAWLPQDVFAHRFRLENLSQEKAFLAILKPAEKFDLPVEEALRALLLADLTDQGLEPANLQIVLYRLYRDAVAQGLWNEATKQGTGLTLARYQALGGTRVMLSGYLDEVINALDSTEAQHQAQAILKNMVTAQQTKAALTGWEIAHAAGLDEAELDTILAYLRARRVVRKFGDDDRYELAHEMLVEKVWAWISDEELQALDIQDMLRREVTNYQKFGFLITTEKMELIKAYERGLSLNSLELELLFHSAVAAGYEIDYWRGYIHDRGIRLEPTNVADRLQDDRDLIALRNHYLNGRLALWVGADLPCCLTGVPSRREIATQLAEQYNLDVALSLAEITQQLQDGINNRYMIVTSIRALLEKHKPDPSDFHKLIVSLGVPTITTTYDDLLYKAFVEFRPGWPTSNHLLRNANLPFCDLRQPILLQLYGVISQPDTLVITESDQYGLPNNSEKEALWDRVQRLFEDYAVLFIGFTLSDPSFRFLWQRVAKRMGPYAIGAWAVVDKNGVRNWTDGTINFIRRDPLSLIKLITEQV